MSEKATPGLRFTCPVMIGPGLVELVRGYGWVFLGSSLILHLLLLALLPRPSSGLADMPPLEVRVRLNTPAAVAETLPASPPPANVVPEHTATANPPAPELGAKPNPGQVKPTPATTPPQAAPANAGEPAGAGRVIGTDGDGGGRPVYSGKGAGGGTGDGSGPAPSPAADAGLPAGNGAGGNPGGSPAAPQPKPPLPAPAPKPQPPPEPASDVKALLGTYAAGVKSAIVRRKAYPGVAERLGHEGSVKVGFVIDARGSLVSAVVKASSGFDELDQAALDAVHAAAPFDEIPAETGKDQLSLSITLKFCL